MSDPDTIWQTRPVLYACLGMRQNGVNWIKKWLYASDTEFMSMCRLPLLGYLIIFWVVLSLKSKDSMDHSILATDAKRVK